jgi:hypothetical protein
MKTRIFFCILLVFALTIVLQANITEKTNIPSSQNKSKTRKPDIWIKELLISNSDTNYVGDTVFVTCRAFFEGITQNGWSSILKVNGKIIKDTNGDNVAYPEPYWGVATNYTYTKAGKHTFECILDYKNEINESDETNNKASETINVIYSNLKVQNPVTAVGKKEIPPKSFIGTDIVIEDVSVKPKSGKSSGGGAESLANCTWKIIGVHPVPFTVRLYIDGKIVGIFDGSIVDSASMGTSSNILWKVTAGTHTIECKADIENAITETNEANNSKSIAIIIPLR